MRLGKLTNAQLEKLVLSKFVSTRKECLSVPRIGDDCAIIDMGGDLAVLSTDPITSATNHIARLSVHINCNDAAAAGATPIGLLVTLLAPPSATDAQIEAIADELSQTAREIGVDILGGHTEVTDSVTRFVTSTTVLACLDKSALLTGMRLGDDIVLTKWAGLEGSMVLSSDFRSRLTMLTESDFDELDSWSRHLSVVPEGRYAAAHGASAMHDVTEGGVYGAAWEMSYSANMGIILYPERIKVHPLTALICRELNLNPMRLLSSGCMLIACADGEALVNGLLRLGIEASVIGKAGGESVMLSNGEPVDPPDSDELYRLF